MAGNQPRRQIMTIQSKGTALITGASSGIGAIYADRLARRGYDLIIVARNRVKLDKLAARLTSETKRSIEVLRADLSDRRDLARVEEILKKDASITLLVNNAGIGTFAPLLNSDVNKTDEMISLNIGALTRLTYAVVPGFVARGAGTIINISSIVAIAPELLNGVYGGSKAFVLAFSHSLQHELASKGIRIQAVLPGATATDFWDIGGYPVSNFPPDFVMTTENLVDAALSGLDQGELVTIPALPDAAEWDRFEAARRDMSARLSRAEPAARYAVKAPAKAS
jgi:short-subunit dehydrogenase